jgi:hypothetical protein
VSDLERWIHLDGPPPADVERLLEAAQGVPVLRPEHQERLDRQLDLAFAEERRRWARQRAMKIGAVVVLGMSAFAAAAAVLLSLVRLPRDDQANNPTPADHRRAREIPTVGHDAGVERR